MSQKPANDDSKAGGILADLAAARAEHERREEAESRYDCTPDSDGGPTNAGPLQGRNHLKVVI